jgi:Family of unknown function (DUF6206)
LSGVSGFSLLDYFLTFKACELIENLEIDVRQLAAFERMLDAATLGDEKSSAKVIAFGEISMVLEIADFPDLVFKRLPIFTEIEKCREWQENCELYLALLNDYAGVTTAPTVNAAIQKNRELSVFYTVQHKLDAESIGNKVLHTADDQSCLNLFELVLENNLRVWDFNADNGNGLETALDSQISNWAVENYDPQNPKVAPDQKLLFLDTSTPFVRDRGRELMDAEAMLKSCPSFMVWLVKLLFLGDVVDRYYDKRRNVIDIIANLYKEGRADLIAPFIKAANEFFEGPAARYEIEPIAEKEIKSYYRLDAFIWTFFLRLRKIDRFISTRILGQPYHFMLPDKIERNYPV